MGCHCLATFFSKKLTLQNGKEYEKNFNGGCLRDNIVLGVGTIEEGA